MRLFAAIPVPQPEREALAQAVAPLQEAGWPVRWVVRDRYHLTLKFFGETPAERLDAIVAMLVDAASDTPPLGCAFTELGAFPASRAPRVLWAGLEAPPALELLQDRVERGADALGYPLEGRPFRPHVTLGRVRDGMRLPPDALERLAGIAVARSFLADEVVLFESRTTSGRGGPVYTARHRVPLAASWAV